MNENEQHIIKPQPAQLKLIHAVLKQGVKQIIFGGAAGGGKTYGVILLLYYLIINHVNIIKDGIVTGVKRTLNEGYNAIVVREELKELTNAGSMWDEAVSFFKNITIPEVKVVFNITHREIIFVHSNPLKRPAKIAFTYISSKDDAEKFQGANLHCIIFEELASFSPRALEGVSYVRSRLRKSVGQIDHRVVEVATCNPNPISSIKTEFLKDYLDAYGYPIPEKAGVIKYYTMVNNVYVWADTEEELIKKVGEQEHKVDFNIKPTSFTFIPSKLEDNKYLDRDDYANRLSGLPEAERQALLNGCWEDFSKVGVYFPKANLQYVASNELPIMTSYVRGWDLAGAVDKIYKNNIHVKYDKTAGVLWGKGIDGYYYILDLIYDQYDPAGVKRKVRETAIADYTMIENQLEQTGKLASYEVAMEQDPAQAGLDQMATYRNEVLKGFTLTRAAIPKKSNSNDDAKVNRARDFSSNWLTNRIKVLKASWNELLIMHLAGFPPEQTSPDIVDAASVGFRVLKPLKKGIAIAGAINLHTNNNSTNTINNFTIPKRRVSDGW